MTPEEYTSLKVGDRVHHEEFGCRFRVGPRGGATFSANVWRVNGKPQRVTGGTRLPIKAGMYTYGHLYGESYELPHWHLESQCTALRDYQSYMESRRRES